MKKSLYIFILISTAISFAFLSCASNPKVIEPNASLSLLSQADVKSGYFGATQNENPYMEPVGILRGRPTEFVVIKLDFSTASEAIVTFSATLKNEKGDRLAELKTQDEMFSFWTGWEGDVLLNRQRELNIRQTYLPASSFEAKPGKYTYYAVLMAKYPIERPSVIHAELNVSGLNPVILDMPLPDSSVGRPKSIF